MPTNGGLPNGSCRLDRTLWPALNSTWSSWQDLVLASQLTALRLNVGMVDYEWRQDEEKLLQVYCRFTSPKAGSGRKRVLLARPAQPDGAGTVTVITVNHSAMRHLEEMAEGPEGKRDAEVRSPGFVAAPVTHAQTLCRATALHLPAETASKDADVSAWLKADFARSRTHTAAFFGSLPRPPP